MPGTQPAAYGGGDKGEQDTEENDPHGHGWDLATNAIVFGSSCSTARRIAAVLSWAGGAPRAAVAGCPAGGGGSCLRKRCVRRAGVEGPKGSLEYQGSASFCVVSIRLTLDDTKSGLCQLLSAVRVRINQLGNVDRHVDSLMAGRTQRQWIPPAGEMLQVVDIDA